MRATQLHIVTYRNDPADAEITSHRLMARAGYIHKISAGLYVYGPLLWRTLGKIKGIVREELDRVGGQEVQPCLREGTVIKRQRRRRGRGGDPAVETRKYSWTVLIPKCACFLQTTSMAQMFAVKYYR